MQFKLCKNVHCFDTRKITAPFFRDHLFCFNAFTDTTYTVWVYLDFFLKICKMPLQFSKVFRTKVFHKWMTLNYPYINLYENNFLLIISRPMWNITIYRVKLKCLIIVDHSIFYRVSTTKPGHRHITHIKIIYELL
jgi:hypothetical protein